jgi:hypothetical protein
VHVVAPSDALKLPSGHSAQSLPDSKLPARHVLHDQAPAPLNVPAAHSSHEPWPAASWNSPAEQGVHWALPVPAANEPAWHCVHAEDPADPL